MSLVPPEAAPDEQPLLTDGDLLAGHDVPRQTADVASVAQNDRRLSQA
jgi:hypothetical protein